MSHTATYQTQLTGRVDQGLLFAAAQSAAAQVEGRASIISVLGAGDDVIDYYGRVISQAGDIVIHHPRLKGYGKAKGLVVRVSEKGVEILGESVYHSPGSFGNVGMRIRDLLPQHYTVLALAKVYRARGFRVSVRQEGSSIDVQVQGKVTA